jgi:hypothetical protein
MKNGNITGSIPPLRSRRNHIAMQGQEVEVVYALTAEPATHCASCGCQLFEGRRRTCKKSTYTNVAT